MLHDVNVKADFFFCTDKTITFK